MSWSSPARRVSDDLGVGEPDLGAGGGGEIGNAAGVPGEVRRPQVGEVGDGFERVVDLGLGEPRPQAGFGVDERDPVGLFVGCGQQVVRVAAELVDDVGIELCAASFASDLEGGVDAVLVVVDLDDVGDVEQPDRQRDLVAADLGRDTLAVPAGEHLLERLTHVGTEPELLGEPRGRDAMRDEPTLDGLARGS